jgi:hypothetical protein
LLKPNSPNFPSAANGFTASVNNNPMLFIPIRSSQSITLQSFPKEFGNRRAILLQIKYN